MSPAITLIEALVVLGVVAVLVAIVSPALRAARESGFRVRSASNARQITAALIMYAQSAQETMPAFEEGHVYRTDEPNGYTTPEYWNIALEYPTLLSDILPFAGNRSVYLSPRSYRMRWSSAWPTSYEFSHSYAGQPALWRAEATPRAELRRPVRLDMVTWPSSKALLWDRELAFLARPCRYLGRDLHDLAPLALSDAAVVERAPSSASTPLQNPFPNPWCFNRLHNTPEGVRGRDY